MIATVFVGLVLALGIHVEAVPTPNLKDEIDTDIGCSENHGNAIIDCATSAMRTKYGEHFYNSGKICEMVEIADECVESINGNCATDAGFSGALSQLQRECDQEKSGFCTENHQHMIIDCANSARRTKYGNTEHIATACEMVEFADECVESINGNCATDAGFSRLISKGQRECDQEKSFCTKNHQHMIVDCANSAMRTKYGEHYNRSGKMCEMVEIADECVESINGNCATDAGFSRALSQLQRKCDQEK